MSDPAHKKAFIFDLDGTLAESKQPLSRDMADLLKRLLEKYKVAVISGGSYGQFERQFIPEMASDTNWDNLFIFPVSGTAFYRHTDGMWQKVYGDQLSDADKRKISSVLLNAEQNLGFAETKTYGEKIEDRGSQITYSALGQSAPVEVKKDWDPDRSKRTRIVELVSPFLSGFNIGIGGMTSIDVTRGGVDKGFGVRKISETLGISISDMIFIGDKLAPGGNDYPARATGIECVEVADPKEAKSFIEKLLQ